MTDDGARERQQGQDVGTPAGERGIPAGHVRPGSDPEAAALFAGLLADLAPRVSLFVRRGFFEPLVPLCVEGDTLTLLARTAFSRDWVRDHYLDELNRSVASVGGVGLQVAVVHDEGLASLLPELESEPEPEPEPPPPPASVRPTGGEVVRPRWSRPPDAPRAAPAAEPARTKGASLNPRYTFDSFVAGPSNAMAAQACRAVAEAPGERYSPLFLFGKTGLGKTHLLHALGHEARPRHRPGLRVVYMSAEQWVNEYIHDIRHQQFDAFRRRYRSGCDLLLIDDIQFLAGKDASQDEFFHTFNSLHDRHRQIVVTADRYPHEIEGLEQRLQTRLSWGLIADIQAPEMETRVAILERKAETLGLPLDGDVIRYLADHIVTSVRALEGALVRLSAYAQVTGARLDLKAAKQYLRPVMPHKRDLTLDQVVQVVAGYYDLTAAELRGKSRQRRLALGRQMAMYLGRKHLGLSLPEIGRYFARDHTTVLASVRKIAGLVATDAGTQAVVGRLERDLL
jgi:chromosomal replication initiator protein